MSIGKLVGKYMSLVLYKFSLFGIKKDRSLSEQNAILIALNNSVKQSRIKTLQELNSYKSELEESIEELNQNNV